jgi:hypothetical protein
VDFVLIRDIIPFDFFREILRNKLRGGYARANFNSNTAYNQLGLNLKLNEYFGLENLEKILGW